MDTGPLVLDEQIHALYKARKTMRTLMRARGYDPMIDPHDQSIDSFLDFYASKNSYLSMTMRAWKEDQLILAFFPPEMKLRIAAVREICEYARECRVSHYLIVCNDQITSFTKTHIAHYKTDNNVKIETISIPQLQFNVTEHEMVPPYRLLSPSEKQAVMNKYMVTEKQLPGILLADPVAKYYGARIGQVFEITKASSLGFFYPTYRIVRKGVYKVK